ncbi:hypothetical protein AMS68_006776 [Peltaster fructicola]|uniref:Capsule polysaccharide biosynthesis protein n=1 Tax=Peltaster fructicola TaxID=286661 RepID=A0A6H0Y321_9PEZI|nr:hypothetical protein AMS68_006776 [Peltaster fructicola]
MDTTSTDFNGTKTMFSKYAMPEGMLEIPRDLLDLRPDAEIDQDILNPPPVRDDKNIWFYWHQGFTKMHPYTQRNVRAYFRRLVPLGWVIRVVDRIPESPLNIDQFLQVNDAKIFPKAYIDGSLTGTYAIQHCSDLVRFPLLLKYGGVYTDVGFLQIGDLDRLWKETIDNPRSPYEVMSYNGGNDDEYCLMNYFLAAKRNNPLFERCHRLFLALWNADGGQLETTGMHKSPLLHGVPLMGGEFGYEDNGRTYSPKETSEILTDYIIQGQATRMVMSMEDPDDAWDGPRYTVEHVFAIEYMEGSQLINEMTSWDGNEAFRLMSLSLPSIGQTETPDQSTARHIVEQCLSRSFGFKLATGLILKVLGETLSSNWRRHAGSDDIEGTYAHWLRYGMLYWTQKDLPMPITYKHIKPLRIGPLTGTN